MQSPKFRLFRLTKPLENGCTHAGYVMIGGKAWTITARVVETPDGRQFHGDVEAPGEAIRRQVRQHQQANDLVAQATQEAARTPFDDPLPF
jgi:hypothetical protein